MMSWEEKLLSDLCEINIGKTPSRDNSQFFGAGEKWVTIADMNGEVFISNTKEQVTGLGIIGSNMKIVPANTVLLSFKLSVGKVGITRVPLYTNEAIASLPIKKSSRLDTKFLYYALKSRDFSHLGERAAKGLTLNKAKLNQIKISLPSLTHQKTITAILDEADALCRQDKLLLAKYDQLQQSIFYKMFGDPIKNEKNWQKLSGHEYSVRITVGVVIQPSSYYVKEGVIALRSLNIRPNEIDLNNLVYFGYDSHIKELNKSILKANDVVIVRTGSTGTAAVVPKTLDGCNCIDLIIVTPNTNLINPFYLSAFFNSDWGKTIVAGKEVGGIQKHFNIGTLKSLKIPAPDIKVQNQFADIVQNLQQQKQKVKRKIDMSETLFQSLLQKAFNGQLIK